MTPNDSADRKGLVVIRILTTAFVAGTLIVGARHWTESRPISVPVETKPEAQPPRVTVAIAQKTEPSAERVLPGTSLAIMEAALYSRATGFVKRRLVDIGDRVEAGQLLAVIDSPDVDDQLAQAKANLDLARANLVKAKADLTFATSEEARYRHLLAQHFASQEDWESKLQAFGVAKAAISGMEASIKVDEAAVQRLADLQQFEKIAAPFQGVITARNIDPGDLVTADSTARELFHIMRTDIIRAFVNVPQTFATGVDIGQEVVLYRREDPTARYTGKVTRTADALDPSSRTLLTQVDIPNPKNLLRAGMYLQAKFAFRRQFFPLMIPVAALATRSAGPRVAVVDNQHRVHFRDVQLGRDFGAEVQVLGGLNANELVVVYPGDDLPDGTLVQPVVLPANS